MDESESILANQIINLGTKLTALDNRIQDLQQTTMHLEEIKEDLSKRQERLLHKQYKLVENTTKTLNLILQIIEEGQIDDHETIPQQNNKQPIPDKDRLPG